MKVILATGIYPPDIGGPATYVKGLEEELRRRGDTVTVITYGEKGVSRQGGPVARWRRYARALREQAGDADTVIAFSSVSVGVPLMMARLRKPRKILRLGGDFFWERFTDRGGMMDLGEWHASWRSWIWRRVMQRILRRFDHVVYSSAFQRDIHRRFYRLPASSVINNPQPQSQPQPHSHHNPFRLLFLGRFVGFKNLPALVRAMETLTDCCLTLVGEGPMQRMLVDLARELRMGDRVSFHPPMQGDDKSRCFDNHDLLVLPSLTEISPNVAAEAAARGLPVLLTESTGLRDVFGPIVRAPLRTPDQIAAAVRQTRDAYPSGPSRSDRPWPVVAEEWARLLTSADRGPARP